MILKKKKIKDYTIILEKHRDIRFNYKTRYDIIIYKKHKKNWLHFQSIGQTDRMTMRINNKYAIKEYYKTIQKLKRYIKLDLIELIDYVLWYEYERKGV